MFTVILFVISIFTSCIGAIVGIGGGTLIKPIVSAMAVFSVSTVSFLSSCTVLSMSVSSLLKSKKSEYKVDVRHTTFFAVGGAIGGITGKILFDFIKNTISESVTEILQSSILIVLTVLTLLYILFKSKIKTRHIENKLVILLTGFVLGIFSSFLGIGGGPLNLIVLYYLFSMETKTASVNSIYVIFFSQLSNLIFTLISGTVPPFEWIHLIAMVIGGIAGGIIGSTLLKRFSGKKINILFTALLIGIIGISIYHLFTI